MGTKFYLSLLLCLSTSAAFARNDGPQTFTLDGQLFEAGTTVPLSDVNTTITVQILNPAKTCILYEETQSNIDTRASGGFFNIQVGSPTGAGGKRTAGDSGNTMAAIYQNMVAVPGQSAPNKVCTGGAYAPSAGDARYFRIIVTPSGTNVADTMDPDMLLDSVPNAVVAQSVQGLERPDILQVNATAPAELTQSNLENIFSTTNYPLLTNLLSGGSFASDVVLGGSGSGLTVTNNSVFSGNVTMPAGTGTFTQTYTGTTAPASTLTADSVTTAAAESISANGLTTGSILSLSSNSTAADVGNTGINLLLSGANTNSGIARTGISSVVSATGTNATNVAGYFSAAGGAQNYGLIVGSGYMGIGTTSPTATLDVVGPTMANTSTNVAYFRSSPSNAGGYSNNVWLDNTYGPTNYKNQIIFGSQGVSKWSMGTDVFHSGTQNFFVYDTVALLPRFFINPSGWTAIGNQGPGGGFDVTIGVTAVSGKGYGERLQQTLTAAANNDTLTGLFINPTFTNGAFTGVNNYGLIVASGNVGVGTTAPQATLDVNGLVRLKANASQPVACAAANNGTLALTSHSTMCVCKGSSTSWVSVNDGSTACTW